MTSRGTYGRSSSDLLGRLPALGRSTSVVTAVRLSLWTRNWPHRVDADDDRADRVERQLVADVAAAEQLAEEAALALRQPDEHARARSSSTAVTSSSPPLIAKRRRSSCMGT